MLPGRTENAVKIRCKQLKREPKDKESPVKYRAKWTEEEDMALSNAVSSHGEKNWRVIAEVVPNRDHVQCLQRYKKVLKEGLAKGAWKVEEDQRLVSATTYQLYRTNPTDSPTPATARYP